MTARDQPRLAASLPPRRRARAGELTNTLTRQVALALIAASAASPVVAKNQRRVLFIGNSFTLQHDLPDLFARISQSLGYGVEVTTVAKNGAYLADHAPDRASRIDLISDHDPDIVVLQEHSLAALNPDESSRSFRAIHDYRFSRKRIVYFAPWPRAEGHKLYSQVGMPRSPSEMVDMTERHLNQSMSFDMSLGSKQLARIGKAWLLAQGISLYARDGYHASLEGAWLAALMLVRTMGFTSSAPPYVPDGMSTLTARRLYQIARMVAP